MNGASPPKTQTRDGQTGVGIAVGGSRAPQGGEGSRHVRDAHPGCSAASRHPERAGGGTSRRRGRAGGEKRAGAKQKAREGGGAGREQRGRLAPARERRGLEDARWRSCGARARRRADRAGRGTQVGGPLERARRGAEVGVVRPQATPGEHKRRGEQSRDGDVERRFARGNGRRGRGTLLQGAPPPRRLWSRPGAAPAAAPSSPPSPGPRLPFPLRIPACPSSASSRRFRLAIPRSASPLPRPVPADRRPDAGRPRASPALPLRARRSAAPARVATVRARSASISPRQRPQTTHSSPRADSGTSRTRSPFPPSPPPLSSPTSQPPPPPPPPPCRLPPSPVPARLAAHLRLFASSSLVPPLPTAAPAAHSASRATDARPRRAPRAPSLSPLFRPPRARARAHASASAPILRPGAFRPRRVALGFAPLVNKTSTDSARRPVCRRPGGVR